MPSIARAHGLDSHPPHVWRRAWEIASERGLDPDALAAVIASESGWDPRAINPLSGASGLLQWMDRGRLSSLGTTRDAVRSMSVESQLELVARDLDLRPSLTSSDIYLHVFAPQFVGRPDSDTIYRAGQLGYEHNKVLDVDRDGTITVGDVRAIQRSRTAAARARGRLVFDEARRRPAGSDSPTRALVTGALIALLLSLIRRIIVRLP